MAALTRRSGSTSLSRVVHLPNRKRAAGPSLIPPPLISSRPEGRNPRVSNGAGRARLQPCRAAGLKPRATADLKVRPTRSSIPPVPRPAVGCQSAHRHVLLQPAQVVHLPADRRLGQHPGSLLERGRGDERLGRERRLRHAQQHRAARRRPAAVLQYPLVLFHEPDLVHDLFDQELRVAHVLDLHPSHHLPRDGLDVLVVDVDALQPVDLLTARDVLGLRGLVVCECIHGCAGHPRAAGYQIRLY